MGISKSNKLKNKNILITAGPTWVPIDSVRVISNVATGQTGILLSRKFKRLGAKVTLLLGPQGACCLDKGIRVIRFKFFDELKKTVLRELKTGRFDAFIHSAAVSDYRPLKSYAGKVKSGLKIWKLILAPTEKIIDAARKIDKNIFLVSFKFESAAKKMELLKRGKALLENSKSDCVVANTVKNNRYTAYILDKHKIKGPYLSKDKLSTELVKIANY